METNDFLDRIHIHTKAIYENEIEQVTENGKITNWLLGLAGGALLFSFSKYDVIENKNITVIIVQALIFIATIFAGYLHRTKTKAYRDYTISIIRMFEFLKIEFEAIPDELENDLENEKLITVFDNYLNGEYFDEDDTEIFENLCKDQINSYKMTKFLTSLSIILMLLQFACFFIIIQ
jgi:hypothetical protein